MAGEWLIVLGFAGIAFFILLIVIMIFFGRLIWLQLRVWMLGKRGFHLVEIIGEDNVRRYYYMRPKDNKFDVNGGFYLFMPDSTTRQTAILRKASKSFLKGTVEGVIPQEFLDKLSESRQKAYIERYNAEREEAKKYFQTVNKLEYHIDAVSLRYGIPTITYYGNESEPINFKNKQKMYDAKTLKDLYLRILLTQKYGFFKKWMIAGVIALLAVAVVMFLWWIFFNEQSTAFTNTLNVCLGDYNVTKDLLLVCTEKVAVITGQNSTIVV